MKKFKKGDKVRVHETSIHNNVNKGDIATVVKYDYGWVIISNPKYRNSCYGNTNFAINESDIRLVEDEQKYDLLKRISLKSLDDSGACESQLAKAALILSKKFGTYDFDSTIPSTIALDIAKRCEGGIDFLLEKGFIKEKEEIKKYTFGAKFKFTYNDKECMLVRIETHKAKMVMLSGDDYWCNESFYFKSRDDAYWTFKEIKEQFCDIKEIK